MGVERPTIFGSRILQDSGPPSASVEHWRSLYYFNLYRLALGVFFVSIAVGTSQVASLGRSDPQLFAIVAFGYGLIGLVSLISITKGRPAFRLQGQLQITADILCITLLMHASGGEESGLGLLLVVSVAGAGVTLGGRMAIFFAALGTVTMMVEFIIAQALLGATSRSPTQLGLFGIALFVTAFLLHSLVSRIRRAETLAERRGIDLASLEQVNQFIIERMNTGVVAADADGNIRVTNETARALLGMYPTAKPTSLPAALEPGFRRFRDTGAPQEQTVTIGRDGRDLAAHFLPLGDAGACLIYLDDTNRLVQQAQQIRLAALGRLSTGIAHEIRNPLGAISHAGQLLDESDHLGGDDRRLLQIIREQCRRVNTLVENVMQLGRREAPQRERINLQHWLQEFVAAFCESRGLPHDRLLLKGSQVFVNMNPEQLFQVVTNLCDNALRYSSKGSVQTPVELHYGTNDKGQGVFDIIDHGAGVPEEYRDRLFEPFFTTGTGGTGLGLYIARELCNANNARLSYAPATSGGSRFRILFERSDDVALAKPA